MMTITLDGGCVNINSEYVISVTHRNGPNPILAESLGSNVNATASYLMTC